MELPKCALDYMIDQLGGTSNVAEMTGRNRRIVRHSRTGKYILDQRQSNSGITGESNVVNLLEKDLFMCGKKNVAIISDAASTGISLHSGLAYKNQKRRVHITLELPWSATKAIQQLGRTHRSNQKTAPIYKLIRTNLGGERRFVSACAARLESLGALTRGDRRAASGADLSASSILKSKYGITGLRKLQECLDSIALYEQSQKRQQQNVRLPSCINVQSIGRDIANAAGQPDRILDARDVIEALKDGHRRTFIEIKHYGKINMFLNRLSALPVAYQNALFEAFASCVSAEVLEAKMKDKYDHGVPEIKASTIQLNDVLQVTERMRAAILTVDRGCSYDNVIQWRTEV